MNLLKITEETLALEKELKNKPLLTDKEEIIQKLSNLLLQAVEKRTNYKKIGIAFSGGIDSTLLAFLCIKLNKKFTLYNNLLWGLQQIRGTAIILG